MHINSYFGINFEALRIGRYYAPSYFSFECIDFSVGSILSLCFFSSSALFFSPPIILRYLIYFLMIQTLKLMQVFTCLILGSHIIFHPLFLKYSFFSYYLFYLHLLMLLFHFQDLIFFIQSQYYHL